MSRARSRSPRDKDKNAPNRHITALKTMNGSEIHAHAFVIFDVRTELCVARQQLVLVLRGMQVDLAKRGEVDELRCCYHLINRGLTSSTTLVNEIFA